LENKKIDVIFHLACPTGVDNLEKLGEEMLFTSAIGTKNVMELEEKQNLKSFLPVLLSHMEIRKFFLKKKPMREK
jgi:nucleoside-diphosphate-sugar epimerase